VPAQHIFNHFRTDRRGTTAVIFGLSLLPLLGFFGAALDYTRAATARTHLQAAVDSAALALARDSGGLTDAQMQARGQVFFDANFQNRYDMTLSSVSFTRDAKLVHAAATGSVKTTIMQVLGFPTMPVSANADAVWGTKTIELSLVLDNTGSMDEWPNGIHKIDALKDAANSLLDTLQSNAKSSNAVKVSIVPFDTQVNVGTAFDPLAVDFGKIKQSKWGGCVIDRQQPYDVDDTAPRLADPNTLFPAAPCSTGSLARLMPLTSDFFALRQTVASMKPSGCTNITMGASWGLKTLSAGAPFTDASPAGTKGVEKFMLIVTDGDNTQNRWVNDCSGSGNVALIDARTQLACDAAKSAGIKVYTIRVINGNAGLLRNCASDPSMYYDVRNANDLKPVFQSIINEISAVRLSM
jgi:Flp pilus assembly protein TadG